MNRGQEGAVRIASIHVSASIVKRKPTPRTVWKCLGFLVSGSNIRRRLSTVLSRLRVVAGVCHAARAEYAFEFTQGYPSLVNDEPLTERAMASVRALLGGEAAFLLPAPEMGGEDFAFFAQQVPATMFRLGVGNETRGIVHPVHSARFDLDEDALPLGAAALARIAMDYVNGTD